MPQNILEADLERQFADWGVTVTHQAVSVSFNALTLTTEETISETELSSLVTKDRSKFSAGTGEQFLDEQIQFTLRTGDLPMLSPGQLRRIVYDGQIYDVSGIDRPAGGAITTLSGRKRRSA